MKGVDLTFTQSMGHVTQLERVDAHVVEGNEARGELAVEGILSCINGPQAGIRVIVGIDADTERAIGPSRGSPPVVVVMAETVHLLNIALAVVHGGEGSLATKLPLLSLETLFFHLPAYDVTDATVSTARLASRPIGVTLAQTVAGRQTKHKEIGQISSL